MDTLNELIAKSMNNNKILNTQANMIKKIQALGHNKKYWVK